MKTLKSFIFSLSLGTSFILLLLILFSSNTLTVKGEENITENIGSINGQIFDNSDMVIPGVTVIALLPNAQTPVVTTTTDNEGDYALMISEEGNYYVRVGKFGYASEFYSSDFPDAYHPQQATLITVTTNQSVANDINFILGAGGSVVGTVDSSIPITNVIVSAKNITEDPNTTPWMGEFVNSDGTYAIKGLAVGQYKLLATAPSFVPQFYNNKPSWATADEVTITVGMTATNKNFTLEPQRGIAGRVHDINHNPITNATVFIERVTDGVIDFIQVNASGHYTFTNLTAGEYHVLVQASGYIPMAYNNIFDLSNPSIVIVSDGIVRGTNFYLPIEAKISGRATNVDGTMPITHGTVRAVSISNTTLLPGDGVWQSETTEFDATGTYTISNLLAGDYKVWIDVLGYGMQFYDHQFNEWSADIVTVYTITKNIDFYLEEQLSTSILGRVVLPDGSPVVGGVVGALSENDMHPKTSITDQTGNFQITNLMPGEWFIQAYPPQNETYQNYAQSEVVFQVITETKTIELTNPLTLTKVSVRGHVVDFDSNSVHKAIIHVYNHDYSVLEHTISRQDGNFQFGGLPTGSYTVEVSSPWGAGGMGLLPPPAKLFVITDTNYMVDLGGISFEQSLKRIVGSVVAIPSQNAVEHVAVVAVQQEDWNWIHVLTNKNGEFELTASPGTWEVSVYPIFNHGAVEWMFADETQIVQFADDNSPEEKQADFIVQDTDATIIGQIQGPPIIPRKAISITVYDTDGGMFNIAPVDFSGNFTVPVVAGVYNVDIEIDETKYPNWHAPFVSPLDVDVGRTNDIGVIQLQNKTSVIMGQVIRSDDDIPVSNVMVHVWQHHGDSISTLTDADGKYHIAVVAADDNQQSSIYAQAKEWLVQVTPPYTSTYVSQPPQRIKVTKDMTATVDFELTPTSNVIQGHVHDANGVPLIDVDGWAYARESDKLRPLAASPIENGQFSMNVPQGTYQIGIWLAPNSGYSISQEQAIDVAKIPPQPLPFEGEEHQETPVQRGHGIMVRQERFSKTFLALTVKPEFDAPDEVSLPHKPSTQQETYTVTFTLLSNDSIIQGEFYTRNATGEEEAVSNLKGEVFALSDEGAWQVTRIDANTGQYELPVSAGTWHLGYSLVSTQYLKYAIPNESVVITHSSTATQNFTVLLADSTIRGIIKNPDGDNQNFAQVWAYYAGSETYPEIFIEDDSEGNGYFEMHVPSGIPYQVGAYGPIHWDMMQPTMQVITPTANSVISLTLQFKEKGGTILGTAYYLEQGTKTLAPESLVWAWSKDGHHTSTRTDSTGDFTLNVVTGTTWYIGANYNPENSAIYYETITPTTVVMSTTNQTADIVMQQAPNSFPEGVVDTFDPAVGWSYTLDDGTHIEIPGGAMPTTDTVRISITPSVDNLLNTRLSRPLRYSYYFSVYENSSGKQIVSDFNTNIIMTWYYTKNELESLGINEDDLSIAFLSADISAWAGVDSVSIDKEANRITAQINHFSCWTMMSSQEMEEVTLPVNSEYIYLPIILK